ncbi:hypothetical protein Hamer_G031006, partial [Homarus americanus]
MTTSCRHYILEVIMTTVFQRFVDQTTSSTRSSRSRSGSTVEETIPRQLPGGTPWWSPHHQDPLCIE